MEKEEHSNFVHRGVEYNRIVYRDDDGNKITYIGFLPHPLSKEIVSSKEKCLEFIPHLEKAIKLQQKADWDRDMPKKNPYKKLLTLVENAILFHDVCNLSWEFYGSGVSNAIITRPNGKKVIYAFETGRWRNEGKNIWYHSKNPKEFFTKYCN